MTAGPKWQREFQGGRRSRRNWARQLSEGLTDGASAAEDPWTGGRTQSAEAGWQTDRQTGV